MSGFVQKLPSLRGAFKARTALSPAASAGPRRLAAIGLGGAAVVALVGAVAMTGTRAPLRSQVARMPGVDPLPGGLHSNPQQDKLALRDAQEHAAEAHKAGQSYTPPMAASQSVTLLSPIVPQAQAAPPSPGQASRPPPRPAAPAAAAPPSAQTAPQVIQVAARAEGPAPGPSQAKQIAQTGGNEQQADPYHGPINSLFGKWGAHSPRTDVVLPPTAPSDAELASTGSPSPVRPSASGAEVPIAPASTMAPRLPANPAARVLVSAGRGVFAHTVLAVNSDTGGPIVLEADTGPIAGDRMIGTFGRAGSSDLLVVRVTSVEHAGETLPADAIVIAPDTMQTAVATSVDQHYLSRFLLPAAAAFVQGLGTAIATTSNTTAVLSPFGGAAYSTRLNLPQQLGVGAGVAAGEVGNALRQAAPRGPTVNLAAHVNVGVMFLTNLTAGRPQ